MNQQALGFTMHMVLKWKWDISFVFESLTVEEGQTGLIILGLALTLLVSVLSVALPSLKNYFLKAFFGKKKQSSLLLKQSEVEEGEDEKERKSVGEQIFSFFYIFFYSLMHILSMMLIMTYNGYVCIAVIIGLALGYSLFGNNDKDKDIPVNCCA